MNDERKGAPILVSLGAAVFAALAIYPAVSGMDRPWTWFVPAIVGFAAASIVDQLFKSKSAT